MEPRVNIRPSTHPRVTYGLVFLVSAGVLWIAGRASAVLEVIFWIHLIASYLCFRHVELTANREANRWLLFVLFLVLGYVLLGPFFGDRLEDLLNAILHMLNGIADVIYDAVARIWQAIF